MLPPEITKLVEEAVEQKIPKYHTATREALQKLIYDYSNRGILKSSAFDRADCEVRIKTFEDLGKNVADAIKEIPFTPTPDCETELISIANAAMGRTMIQEIDSFRFDRSRQREFQLVVYQERCQRVRQETETAIKIHVHSLRHQHHHWTTTPAFWFIVITALLTAAILYYTIVLAHNDKQEKQSVPQPQSLIGNSNQISNSSIVNGNGNTVAVDNSQRNYYGDTNHPAFKLYVNDPDTEFTRGSFIKLNETRQIQMFVKNVSSFSVPDLTVVFVPTGDAASNLDFSGWQKIGESVSTWHFLNTTAQVFRATRYAVHCGLTPPNVATALPLISISKDFVPKNTPTNYLNFYPCSLVTEFDVYATGSPLQIWDGLFYVQGQDFPQSIYMKMLSPNIYVYDDTQNETNTHFDATDASIGT